MKITMRENQIGQVNQADTITMEAPGPRGGGATSAALSVLLLAANPRGTTPLALDEEARSIDQKIRMSDHRAAVQLTTAWAVRPDDLLQKLYEHRPSVVHFSGHGVSNGSIVLLDAQGAAKVISTDALEAVFVAMKDRIRLVFLNTCYSERQAEAIGRHIDYVVGMNAPISDPSAIVFAAAFYRALGFMQSVQQAFDQARASLMLEGKSGANTPRLLVRAGVDARRPLLLAGAQGG